MYFSTEDFINELDSFYMKNDMQGAGECLVRHLGIAQRQNNRGAEMCVLSEMTGYYRQTGDSDRGLGAVNALLAIIDIVKGLPDKDTGTYLLNCATTLCSFNLYDKAYDLFISAEGLLLNSGCDSALLAGFYNNFALCLKSRSLYDRAGECYEKALDLSHGSSLEEAMANIALAHFLYERDSLDERVCPLIERAIDLLKTPQAEKESKYAYTLTKCAPSFEFFGYFLDAKHFTKRAEEIYADNRRV